MCDYVGQRVIKVRRLEADLVVSRPAPATLHVLLQPPGRSGAVAAARALQCDGIAGGGRCVGGRGNIAADQGRKVRGVAAVGSRLVQRKQCRRITTRNSGGTIAGPPLEPTSMTL